MQFIPVIRQSYLPFIESFSFATKHAISQNTICFCSMSFIPSHTRAGCSSSFEIFRLFLRLSQICVMLPMCACFGVVLLQIKLRGSKLYRSRFLPCAFERNIAWMFSVHTATKSESIDAHKASMLFRTIPKHCYTIQGECISRRVYRRSLEPKFNRQTTPRAN